MAEGAVLTQIRRFKCTCSYDGTAFSGWQSQTEKNLVTVQGVLSNRLTKFLREPTRVIGSGRTDAGVHAIAQVFHFDLNVYEPPARECALDLSQVVETVNSESTEQGETQTVAHDESNAQKAPYSHQDVITADRRDSPSHDEHRQGQQQPSDPKNAHGSDAVGTMNKKKKPKNEAGGKHWGRGAMIEELCASPDAAFLLLRALRSIPGIQEGSLSVFDVVEKPDTFHARLSVSNKRYRYVIREDSASPFEDRYCWALCLDRNTSNKRLDMSKLRAASAHVLGPHDMRNFAILAERDPRSPVRNITRLDIDVYDIQLDPIYTMQAPMSAEYDAEAVLERPRAVGLDTMQKNGRPCRKVVITVECDYFLMRMVRMLVGTLVDVGLGALSVEDFEKLLTPEFASDTAMSDSTSASRPAIDNTSTGIGKSHAGSANAGVHRRPKAVRTAPARGLFMVCPLYDGVGTAIG
ncbi:hypothetical protein SARC_11003 [Sphaeroforma arctica JP610]|uniref:tRNA pseudouridine synthase n=1 Tax=Sphaeroforma arctica JP610 TaxID=667725 RepID=A0A0L0FI87_9EUKA|nr:hypothetical protein SARC_11003 [Sphaeroforma arctica JP610]KNC76494.1 hypothetical protein SARC_11003 [Sphaeroforma arctica JP610]|eukprot:XP_014150396.1 hypothetical protein SARC_11003 [Sphaeroforma arctica JP610]